MKKWIRANSLSIAGALLGAMGGFLYWKFIGCNSGTCRITSNPLNSTIYFAVMGALLPGLFKRSSDNQAKKKA
ncbi:MAG TPA: DUF6132 family protein [Chitinophagaceae bacterium]|nr:DUF6132 family protein [Chitinophagaceae bacterium]